MKPVVFRAASLLMRIILIISAPAFMPVPVSAHAILVSSTPKDNAVLTSPPKKAVLRFDSKIEKGVSQVTLLKDKSEKVALPKPSGGYTEGPPNQLIIPMPPLKPGSYQLQYKVLATDGHLTPGLIRFTITGRKVR